jgi:hypothetical protein
MQRSAKLDEDCSCLIKRERMGTSYDVGDPALRVAENVCELMLTPAPRSDNRGEDGGNFPLGERLGSLWPFPELWRHMQGVDGTWPEPECCASG